MRSSKSVPRVGKMVAAVILVIVAAILAFGSAYSITEQEQAVVTTFGKAKTVSEPGLHFKIPFIQQVQKVDTTIKGFPIGYSSATEYIEEESLMITNDFNFVNVDFFVEYKVSDPVKALFASEEPVAILKNLAQSSIRSVVGSFDVDSVITTGKGEIQAKIKEMIVEKLEEHDIGIQLINITIQDAEPPTDEVMEAFKQVETAKQGKDTAINNANKYKNEKMPEAEAKIDQILKDAQAQKEARINEAEGQAARFNAMYEEYRKNPLITKQRMFYEAMEELLPDMEVILDSTDTGVQKILPLDSLVGESDKE
ncbi:MAG: FtsH protease activity modulator HflK [Lachnospiraceae bacterium]|nr:FtsH protease activity modulator HflK [Lachnospiraceae bacterium]